MILAANIKLKSKYLIYMWNYMKFEIHEILLTNFEASMAFHLFAWSEDLVGQEFSLM